MQNGNVTQIVRKVAYQAILNFVVKSDNGRI